MEGVVENLSPILLLGNFQEYTGQTELRRNDPMKMKDEIIDSTPGLSWTQFESVFKCVING